jgi:hypothetical protein
LIRPNRLRVPPEAIEFYAAVVVAFSADSRRRISGVDLRARAEGGFSVQGEAAKWGGGRPR